MQLKCSLQLLPHISSTSIASFWHHCKYSCIQSEHLLCSSSTMTLTITDCRVMRTWGKSLVSGCCVYHLAGPILLRTAQSYKVWYETYKLMYDPYVRSRPRYVIDVYSSWRVDGWSPSRSPRGDPQTLWQIKGVQYSVQETVTTGQFEDWESSTNKWLESADADCDMHC